MNDLKKLLGNADPEFWTQLRLRTESTNSFTELMTLSNLRKRANSALPTNGRQDVLRIAVVGGSTLYPLSDLLEHAIETTISPVAIWTGEFNNFRSEMLQSSEELDDLRPNFFLVIPEEKSCSYGGPMTDDRERVQKVVDRFCADLLHLCETAYTRHGAEIILCNFLPSPFHDIGEFGTKSPASDWNFKRAVNLALAERAPNYVHICDLEFLAYRSGGLAARDDRAWYESKQAFSPAMQAAIAKEAGHVISSLKKAPKKVLVLDLDNTLWGGVIGDDGMEGIEIGDTSPRGEAFKALQTYIRSLTERGVLLAVSSKNDHENAIAPFREHPEMVLREEHFVSFKANWEPKAKNIQEMAEELSLGLDSFVFVDDNPAEIEIVRQFAPEVTTILLSDDPAEYVRQLQESRLFERTAITSEDSDRTKQYKNEADRRRLEKTVVDMDSYLESLDMVATIRDFNRLDLPRITQLINKSNQFNLTTRRRSEAEIEALMADPTCHGFTVRLADRFGDHGLIAIVICRVSGNTLEIDTWLMSCRVLKRQVEDEVLNEIVRRARVLGCPVIRGRYVATAKNGMVRDLLPSLGFEAVRSTESESEFELLAGEPAHLTTFIKVNVESVYHANGSTTSISSAAVNI